MVQSRLLFFFVCFNIELGSQVNSYLYLLKPSKSDFKKAWFELSLVSIECSLWNYNWVVKCPLNPPWGTLWTISYIYNLKNHFYFFFCLIEKSLSTVIVTYHSQLSQSPVIITCHNHLSQSPVTVIFHCHLPLSPVIVTCHWDLDTWHVICMILR